MSQDAVHTTARLYLCTDARQGRGDFADFVDEAFAGGVDIIQLRDKSLEAAEELELLEVLHQAARRHNRLWAVNDRADLASLAGAPVFHIGQKDIPTGAARTFLGKDTVIGLSTHSPEQVDAALASSAGSDGLDYFCVGPVWATPTKPGRAAVGLDLVRYAAEAGRRAGAPAGKITEGKTTEGKTAEGKTAEGQVADGVPWFAIGGIDLGNVEEVVAAGARRIVVVRAITEADDPAGAARALLAALDAAGN